MTLTSACHRSKARIAAWYRAGALALFLGLAGPAAASLIGDQITGCVEFNDGSCNPASNYLIFPGATPQSNTTTVADPGIEWTINTPFGFPTAGTFTTTIEFTADTLTIRMVNNCGNCGTSSTAMRFNFSDLDFGTAITGVTTIQNGFGFSAPSFGPDSLSLGRSGLMIFTPQMDITSSYRFVTAAATPEPGMLALLALGLAACAGARRRRVPARY